MYRDGYIKTLVSCYYLYIKFYNHFEKYLNEIVEKIIKINFNNF